MEGEQKKILTGAAMTSTREHLGSIKAAKVEIQSSHKRRGVLVLKARDKGLS